jgi:ATP-dependent Clp protease ATP-binding subunit ClpA
VLEIELANFQERLGRRQVELKLNAECRSYLVEKYDRRYGARHIVRRLRRDLEPAVARAMLANPDYGEFIAVLRNQGIIVESIQ